MEKAYDPKKVEDSIYKKWEESGFFNPDNFSGDHYSIMMPPPNVTGVLHLGHALENTLMDIMARYQRMRGKKVLLLPGTDHAAVATQAKVEKVLIEQGIKNPRKEFGREKLLEKIREYAEDSKSTILKQIRRMGTSCDWGRLAYTFDETRSMAVNKVFEKMFDDGLIYRGHRVINWSVKGQSTCSDDELIYVERPGKLYTFRYSHDFPISIATTRPETKFGDTAVAVHPNDKRYKKYIGKEFIVNIGAAKSQKIKIIANKEVDKNFGTGAIGVTPAHSIIDYEMYEQQKSINDPIDLVSVIGKDGRMTSNAGKQYAGLTAIAAREKFVEWLKKEKLLEKEEEIMQNVSTSDRFGDIVEALPMTQWFVAVNKNIPGKDKSLKDLMREAITIGHNNDEKQKITITPDRFEKAYLGWIDNLRDWCISRQVWWGHRIPVWYRVNSDFAESFNLNSNSSSASYVNDATNYIFSVDSPGKLDNTEDRWLPETDTLDTWFSSGLWTFSTLGWPENTKDFQNFHPTSWMQMGYEILFFWMARMILMSTYTLDAIPFKYVYIHGMLRDEKGNKFSKSAGNNIDPIGVIDNYGADALRLSLTLGITPGGDSKFYYEKIEGARNLVNKLWNISRYILQTVNGKSLIGEIDPGKITLTDTWILKKMMNLILNVNHELLNYNFSSAGEKLRDFTWNDLADWYLEASKFEKSDEKEKILSIILKDLLKLWHPFMPFITEEIWQQMDNSEFLMVEKWPEQNFYEDIIRNSDTSFNFEIIQEIIVAIRNARAENKIEPVKKVEAIIYAGEQLIDLIKSQEVLIKSLRTGIEKLEIKENPSAGEKEIPDNAIKIVISGGVEIYLIGAVDKEKEKERIKKEIENLEKYIKGLDQKLQNKDFVKKAPEAVVKAEKDKLKDSEDKLNKLQDSLKNL